MSAELSEFLATVEPSTWYDLGPHMTCDEYDAAHAFLLSVGAAPHAFLLAQGHAEGDVESDDRHAVTS